MGAWGYDLLENDDALDIKQAWEEALEKYASKKPGQDKHAIIAAYVKSNLTKQFVSKRNCNDWEILGLAKIIHEQSIKLPKKFKQRVEIAVTRELQENELEEWEAPDGRKKLLLDFLTSIKGKLQDLAKITQDDPLLEFPNKTELFNRIKVWLDDENDLLKEYPQLFKDFDRIIKSRLAWDQDIEQSEALTQRMMMMVFYFFWSYKFRSYIPAERVIEMVEKAMAKDDYVIF